jgi:hypothetical protein
MMGLGFVPAFQFSNDPANNPNLTPFMQMPPGMFQTTRQPVGPYMTGMNGVNGPYFMPRPPLRGAALGGISDTITNLGTVFVVGLAIYGGYTAYKKLGAKKSTAK